jgi:putative transcriptional regulator
MKDEDLVEVVNDTYTATVKGVEVLFTYLANLENYLAEKKRRLGLMQLTTAIAGDDIRQGDTVWLFMEEGYLVARRNKQTTASATAVESALRGEDVAVRNVTGIIDLSPGHLSLFSLPPAGAGGSKTAPVTLIRERIASVRADKIGVMDAVGKALLLKLSLPCDFEFSPISTALELLQKGFDVLLLGEKRDIHRVISRLEDYNAGAFAEISYTLHVFDGSQRVSSA